MQVLTETIGLDKCQEYRGVSFMSEGGETELVYRAVSGDAEAKLQLVKEHLNLVVELAAGYASETGKPFPEMVQVGALAIVKAADNFHLSQQIGFSDHARGEVIKAMEGVSYL